MRGSKQCNAGGWQRIARTALEALLPAGMQLFLCGEQVMCQFTQSCIIEIHLAPCNCGINTTAVPL